MFWIYMIIYFFSAVTAGLIIYTLYIRQYVKEQSHLKFKYWIGGKIADIIFLATVWFVALPVWVIKCAIKAIIKRINKHYNIE